MYHFARLYTLLYADDTLVLAESIAELQKALNALFEYCNSFKLTASTTKRKVMVFSNGRIRILPDLFDGNDTT